METPYCKMGVIKQESTLRLNSKIIQDAPKIVFKNLAPFLGDTL